MTRPLRIQFEGAWYHVLNRGACRKPIFNSVHQRLLFINLLAEIVQIYKIEVHAYCLMDNYFHILNSSVIPLINPFANKK
ncbi:MAG: transposase [Gammaproteobacteria bacterium]|nr:transposase [Gammaproteobacteria bacterium]